MRWHDLAVTLEYKDPWLRHHMVLAVLSLQQWPHYGHSACAQGHHYVSNSLLPWWGRKMSYDSSIKIFDIRILFFFFRFHSKSFSPFFIVKFNTHTAKCRKHQHTPQWIATYIISTPTVCLGPFPLARRELLFWLLNYAHVSSGYAPRSGTAHHSVHT